MAKLKKLGIALIFAACLLQGTIVTCHFTSDEYYGGEDPIEPQSEETTPAPTPTPRNQCYVPDQEVYNLKLQLSVVLTHFFPRDYNQAIRDHSESNSTKIRPIEIRNCTLTEIGKVIIDLSEFMGAVWQAVESPSGVKVHKLEASKTQLMEDLSDLQVRDVGHELQEFQDLLSYLNIAFDSALQKVKTFKLKTTCRFSGTNETYINDNVHRLLDLLNNSRVETAADEFFQSDSQSAIISGLMDEIVSSPTTSNLTFLRNLLDFTELLSDGAAEAITLAGFIEASSNYTALPLHWPSWALALKHDHLLRSAHAKARGSLKSALGALLIEQAPYLASIVKTVVDSWTEGEPGFHGPALDILPPPVVAELAVKSYNSSASNFEGVISTLRMLNNSAQRFQAYKALMEEMSKLDQIDTPHFVQLAFEVKSLQGSSTTEVEKLIAQIPSAVRNLVFPSSNCTLKSRSHNRLLYASETPSLSLDKWPHLLYLTPRYNPKPTPAYQWRLESGNGGKTFKIWNGLNMLYAANETHPCTKNSVRRRYVGVAGDEHFTGSSDDAEWKVLPADGGRSLQIISNFHENEMMYGEGDEDFQSRSNGKGVFAAKISSSWGSIRLETLWEIKC